MKRTKTQQKILSVLAGHVCFSCVQHSSGRYKKIYLQALEELEEQGLVYQDHEGTYKISEEDRNVY